MAVTYVDWDRAPNFDPVKGGLPPERGRQYGINLLYLRSQVHKAKERSRKRGARQGTLATAEQVLAMLRGERP